jgi:hypothetical protein
MSDKDAGSEDKKGKADQPEANSSSSKPSMSFKDMYAKYESFSLKQSISQARETANEYLAKIPKAMLPKVDETAFDVFSRPLHNFSEKMEMDYPYLADIARSHGAELVAVPTISAAYLLRRKSQIHCP